jgi:hypothetical protein
MRTGTPVFDEDRVLVELAAKKTAVYLQGFLSLGISACLHQVPSPQYYFPSRREVFHALAVVMRCVHGPTELAYVLSQIEDSSRQIDNSLDQIVGIYDRLVKWTEFERSSLHSLVQRVPELTSLVLNTINQHLRLVGSAEIIDESIVTCCKEVAEAILPTIEAVSRSGIRDQ